MDLEQWPLTGWKPSGPAVCRGWNVWGPKAADGQWWQSGSATWVVRRALRFDFRSESPTATTAASAYAIAFGLWSVYKKWPSPMVSLCLRIMGANLVRRKTGVRSADVWIGIGFSRSWVQLSFVKRNRAKTFSDCHNFDEKKNADLGSETAEQSLTKISSRSETAAFFARKYIKVSAYTNSRGAWGKVPAYELEIFTVSKRLAISRITSLRAAMFVNARHFRTPCLRTWR